MKFSTKEQKIFDNFPNWRKRLYDIIFGYDSFAGRLFDVLLLSSILLSIIVVMLESVSHIRAKYQRTLDDIELALTILFTLEYIARLICCPKPKRYVKSPMGIIDILAIIPTYMEIFISGAGSLMAIRSIRLLRVFRILKLTHFVGGAGQITTAMYESRHKIIVFLVSVLCIIVMMGTLMYLIEDGANGFTSIPRSIYWAIITLTTVGYGDIVPSTVLGQAIAAFIMIIGYAIIAVPTGIVTKELMSQKVGGLECQRCFTDNLPDDSNYCKKCGAKLEKPNQKNHDN